MKSFYLEQDSQQKELYLKLLSITASLSRLFTESNCPYLYYRSMENIFCKAFNALNLSRGDISVDASKDGIGIGLKTFLHNKGSSFQKVAEFNASAATLKDLEDEALVKKVSELRNNRLLSTKRMCKLNSLMYHLVTRSNHQLSIYEESMDLIDINNLTITKADSKVIHFTDGINEYSFNRSKTTLLKKFYTPNTSNISNIHIDIINDPYEYILNPSNQSSQHDAKENLIIDYIVLPLYSPRNRVVHPRSGLNQAFAQGRTRHPDEVYIPIPAWIHKCKKDFFLYNTSDFKTDKFAVQLPNGETISMKVAQAGGKALMSNPNKELGKWILRDILQLEPGTIVTIEDLDRIGIDSVKLSKINHSNYCLDFLKSGSYQQFEEEFKTI